jgi:hypothetical protein
MAPSRRPRIAGRDEAGERMCRCRTWSPNPDKGGRNSRQGIRPRAAAQPVANKAHATTKRPRIGLALAIQRDCGLAAKSGATEPLRRRNRCRKRFIGPAAALLSGPGPTAGPQPVMAARARVGELTPAATAMRWRPRTRNPAADRLMRSVEPERERGQASMCVGAGNAACTHERDASEDVSSIPGRTPPYAPSRPSAPS